MTSGPGGVHGHNLVTEHGGRRERHGQLHGIYRHVMVAMVNPAGAMSSRERNFLCRMFFSPRPRSGGARPSCPASEGAGLSPLCTFFSAVHQKRASEAACRYSPSPHRGGGRGVGSSLPSSPPLRIGEGVGGWGSAATPPLRIGEGVGGWGRCVLCVPFFLALSGPTGG
jgi:hypothetical protein